MVRDLPLLQGLFPVRVNVGEEAFLSNIRSAIGRDLPWLQKELANEGRAIIVGGGPSLASCKGEIIRMANIGKVFALNNAAEWLESIGVVPDYHVLLDAKLSTVRFVRGNEKTQHLIASQCSPLVFKAAKNVTLWHPNVEGIKDLIGDRVCALIGGGTTVGLQAMSIAYTLGFRTLHLYGFDSSYEGTEGHAYKQPENDGEELIDVLFANRRFKCAAWMIRQTEEFKGVLHQLLELDCSVSVSGDGFLPVTFRELLKTTLTAVYDLAVSPPTYDFISFLAEAERARIEAGHTHLDVVFMAGPVDGFREDNLPPDTAARDGMLARICVPACRLLPSVRNVSVLKNRQDVEGNIFPHGWTVLTPVHHYGTFYLKNALRCLRATASARRAVKVQKPYVTITLRQAEYWPKRNSNLDEWSQAAQHMAQRGFEVVWLEDTSESADVAAWDVDIRLALYEGAACNLGVSNGPMALCYVSDVSYLVFKLIAPDSPTASAEFLRANGMEVGDQFGGNGRLVWEDDNADVIIREFDNFLELKKAA